MPRLHFVVPDGIDDPGRPSGGNVYDRRLADGLAALGWTIDEHRVTVGGPVPTVPSGSTVVVDGLVGWVTDELRRYRNQVILLVHMDQALPDADLVVVTSEWSRRWLTSRLGLRPDRISVVTPGTDPAPLAADEHAPPHLLYVGALTPDKGHDVLFAALRQLDDLAWRCTCAGAHLIDPVELRPPARVRFTGALTAPALSELRSSSDLIVSASRRESYGMAIAEGLAHGLPAIVTDVGGHPEVLGPDHHGSRAGVLVPAGDADALAGALRRWLTDAGLRASLRRGALRRRETLPTWSDAVQRFAAVLAARGVGFDTDSLVPHESGSTTERHRSTTGPSSSTTGPPEAGR